MRLSDLGRERKITVPYDGEEIGIVFRPAAVNADWLERMGEEGKDARTYVGLLSEALVSWDIEGDDGTPLPVSVDVLWRLPVDLLNLLAQAMIEGLAPKK